MPKKTTFTLPGQTPFLGCHAARANDLCFTAMTAAPVKLGIRDTDVLSQFTIGMAWNASRCVLEGADTSLTKLGASIAKGVKIEQFISSPEVGAPYLSARTEWTETATRPASSTLMVRGLSHPEAQVSIHVLGNAGSAVKEPVVVPGLPASPGKPFKPAPHAMICGDFLYVTGQIAYDFDDGYPAAAELNDETTWYESVTTAQCRYVIGKYNRILSHLGGSLQDCVRLEIYLVDIAAIVDVELLLRAAFGEDMPARVYVPVTKLGAGRCVIEVAAIFRRPGSREPIVRIVDERDGKTWLSPAAVEFGGFVFTSTLGGNMPGRLDVVQSLPDQVACLTERLSGLKPLEGNLDGLIFADLQIAETADLSEARWALQQTDLVATTPVTVVLAKTLVWKRGALQADFVCAV